MKNSWYKPAMMFDHHALAVVCSIDFMALALGNAIPPKAMLI
ncbi:MAG: hypothetical protein ACREFV_12345 [Acetobacteraceae bacterium]